MMTVTFNEWNEQLKTMDGESWSDRTERLGVLLGYPKCCIDEFIEVDHRQRRKLIGTGYVPCERCNEKSEEELIDTINSNRNVPTKFPKSPWDEQCLKLVFDNNCIGDSK